MNILKLKLITLNKFSKLMVIRRPSPQELILYILLSLDWPIERLKLFWANKYLTIAQKSSFREFWRKCNFGCFKRRNVDLSWANKRLKRNQIELLFLLQNAPYARSVQKMRRKPNRIIVRALTCNKSNNIESKHFKLMALNRWEFNWKCTFTRFLWKLMEI